MVADNIVDSTGVWHPPNPTSDSSMTGVKESIRRVESEESPTANGSLKPDRERTSGVKKALPEAGQAFPESHTSSGVPQTGSPLNGSR